MASSCQLPCGVREVEPRPMGALIGPMKLSEKLMDRALAMMRTTVLGYLHPGIAVPLVAMTTYCGSAGDGCRIAYVSNTRAL